jgi:hypothetical protein
MPSLLSLRISYLLICHHGDRGWFPISDFSGGNIPVQHVRETRAAYRINQLRRADSLRGLRSAEEADLVSDPIMVNLSYSQVKGFRFGIAVMITS